MNFPTVYTILCKWGWEKLRCEVIDDRELRICGFFQGQRHDVFLDRSRVDHIRNDMDAAKFIEWRLLGHNIEPVGDQLE